MRADIVRRTQPVAVEQTGEQDPPVDSSEAFAGIRVGSQNISRIISRTTTSTWATVGDAARYHLEVSADGRLE